MMTRRLITVFTMIITLSAHGAQANNMTSPKSAWGVPDEAIDFGLIGMREAWDSYRRNIDGENFERLRISYQPESMYYEAAKSLEETGINVTAMGPYTEYRTSFLGEEQANRIEWFRPDGAWESELQGHLEATSQHWTVSGELNTKFNTSRVQADLPFQEDAMPSSWGELIANERRSDPADAGDLLILMASSSGFDASGAMQTGDVRWLAEAVARSDPADAGYLLQPMLLANANF